MAGSSESHLKFQVFGDRTIYKSPWVELGLVDVERPDGQRFESHVIRMRSVAVAAIVNDDDKVLMLWRHRFVNDDWGWELPGGIVDPGEDALVTAGRETLEETGWKPGDLRHLLTFQPIPGMVDMPYVLFVGSDAQQIAEPTDAEEVGEVRWVPMTRVLDLAKRGDLLGSGTLVSLLYLLAMRQRTVGESGGRVVETAT